MYSSINVYAISIARDTKMNKHNLDFDRDIEINYILSDLKVLGKKSALGHLADHIAETFKVPAPVVLDQLIVQEANQNSSMGDGVAIPTLSLKQAKAPYTILARLARPVPFESVDDEPVDLICLVVSPAGSGPLKLRRLSRISRLLKNQELVGKIRSTDDEDTIRALIHNPDGWMMAA